MKVKERAIEEFFNFEEIGNQCGQKFTNNSMKYHLVKTKNHNKEHLDFCKKT